MIFDLLLSNPLDAVMLFLMIVAAIGIHEFAHAFAADKLGDPTPRMNGRVTLNPIAHLDPWGTLLIVFAGIGWGRPVVFNPYNLKNPRRDTALIALAGPLSNIIMAILTALIMVLMGIDAPTSSNVSVVLFNFFILNIALAIFNLVPIEPLDGFKVVEGILPPHLVGQWEETRRYGIFILLVLIFTGAISRIVQPTIFYVADLIFGLFKVLGL